MGPIRDVVVSTEFPPTVGGAHGLLYQVYRRWPKPVVALTRALCGENSRRDAAEFDAAIHGAMIMRRDFPDTPDISLLKPAYLRTLASQIVKIRSTAPGSGVTLHALRAFPEGIAALGRKLLNPGTTFLVTYAHGEEISIARSSGQLRALSRFVYHGSNLVIANSRNTERLVREIAPRARVVCVHPGVDNAAFQPDPIAVGEFRRALPWPRETVVLCTVARMEERKNQIAVVRAVAKLCNEGLNVAYICAGSGPELSRLKQAAGDLAISERVLFPGEVSDEHRGVMIQASDVYIMPSVKRGLVFEGFGMVFLEAAAAGRPSISGNSGGQPEAVLHGETGLVVDGDVDEEICSAIRQLLDPDTRAAMGRKAMAWAARNDWTEVAESVWAQVCAASHNDRVMQ